MSKRPAASPIWGWITCALCGRSAFVTLPRSLCDTCHSLWQSRPTPPPAGGSAAG